MKWSKDDMENDKNDFMRSSDTKVSANSKGRY